MKEMEAIDKHVGKIHKKFMDKPSKILVKADALTLQGIAQYFVRLDGDGQKYAVLKDLFAGLSV